MTNNFDISRSESGKYKKIDDAVFLNPVKKNWFYKSKNMQMVSVVTQNMKTFYVRRLKKKILNIWSFFL